MDLPTFVINLDRDAEKLAAVSARLAQQGLAFERVPATDGRAMAPAARSAACTPACAALCPPGAVGCFLSHMRVWRAVVERGLPAALVLEDDVAFRPGGVDLIGRALAEAPAGWHVVLAGCFTCQGELLVERLVGLAVGAGQAADVSEHLRVPSQTFGSQAYVVSAAGAAMLLQLFPRASWHLDWELGRAMRRGLRLYTTRPDATYQTGMDASSIASRAPVLLNAAAHAVPVDQRSLAWMMSVPLLAAGDAVVNGWALLATAAAAWLPGPVLLVLAVDGAVAGAGAGADYSYLYLAAGVGAAAGKLCGRW